MLLVAVSMWGQKYMRSSSSATQSFCPHEASAHPVGEHSWFALFESSQQLSTYDQAFISGVMVWVKQNPVVVDRDAAAVQHGQSYYLAFKRASAASAREVVYKLTTTPQDNLSSAPASSHRNYCVVDTVKVRVLQQNQLSYLGLTQRDHFEYFRAKRPVYLVPVDEVDRYESCKINRIRYSTQ